MAAHKQSCANRQLKQLAPTTDHLCRDHSSIWVFLQHKMDDIYANPSSPLFSVLPLGPTFSFPGPPSFQMCTEIGCASVLCGSVTVPLCPSPQQTLSSGFYFTCSTGTAVLGMGGLSNRTSGEHVPPSSQGFCQGAKGYKHTKPTQMNHIDLPWSILSAYYEKKIFLWILILL